MQVLTARKNKHQDSLGRSISSGSTGAGASVSRLNPPPTSGSGLARNAAPQQQQAPTSAPAQPPQPSYLDAFTELQQVCCLFCVNFCVQVCSCVSVVFLARHITVTLRQVAFCLGKEKTMLMLGVILEKLMAKPGCTVSL